MKESSAASKSSYSIDVVVLTFFYFAILGAALWLPAAAQDQCLVIKSTSRDVFQNFATRVWGMIILDLIALYFALQFFLLELPESRQVARKIQFDDQIKGNKIFRIGIHEHANAKTRVLFLYPCAMFFATFVGASLLRCIASSN
jgi:hypothetical protein